MLDARPRPRQVLAHLLELDALTAPKSSEVLLPCQYVKLKMSGMSWPVSRRKVPCLAFAPRVPGGERHSSGKSFAA